MPHTDVLFALGALVLSTGLAAQQPAVLHAHLSTVAVAPGDLSREINQIKTTHSPTWVGYQIAMPRGFHSGSDSSQVSFLETGEHSDWHGPYHDAVFDHADILIRISGDEVGKLRLEHPDRQLDAGGLNFVWLTGIDPAESIRLLKSIALSTAKESVANDAVFFISIHESAETVPALADLAATGHDERTREKAAFWLANQSGAEGFHEIQKLARQDKDAQFREKLTFDLTLCHDPGAADELIRMAREDASPQVRRQAQFWMANLGGKKIAADLRSSSEDDPEESVRKSAVFALSRLPGDEAASQLIEVAKTSKDPAVRKQAVFWLGQSSDPRAFEYLTQLIRQ